MIRWNKNILIVLLVVVYSLLYVLYLTKDPVYAIERAGPPRAAIDSLGGLGGDTVPSPDVERIEMVELRRSSSSTDRGSETVECSSCCDCLCGCVSRLVRAVRRLFSDNPPVD